MGSMGYRRFLLSFFVVLAVGSAAAAVTDFVVDPYDIWRAGKPRLVPTRPEVRFHDRQHKAVEVWRRQATVAALGSSRVQIGIPDESPAYGDELAINLGLPGGTMYEVLRYLQFAHAVHPLHTVVLGLDPLMFDGNTRRASVEFNEGRLATSHAPRPGVAWEDVAPTLLSFDALNATRRTLLKRGRPDYVSAGGARTEAFMQQEFDRLGGAHAMFQLSDKSYLAWFRCFRLPREKDPPHFDDFQALLDFVQAQHLALKLYISPVHARQLALVQTAGQWEAREAWLRRVVQLVAAANARDPAQPLEVWDFSGPTAVTAEELPNDAAQPMARYWDTSHFKFAIGHRVLAHLLRDQRDPGFGEALNPATLEQRLVSQRQAVAAWRASHPTDDAELAHAWAELNAQAGSKSCEGVRDQAAQP
jgi:hypothetical protein